jgi:hypothetical protein
MTYRDLLWSAGPSLLLILCALILAFVWTELAARYSVRVARRRSEAEQRASALLMRWLSPTQRSQYDSAGYFEVTGSHSGKRYRIRSRRQMNVEELDEAGRRVAVLCFGTETYVPPSDVMLAQKIALENDELAALAVANRNSLDPSRAGERTGRAVPAWLG